MKICPRIKVCFFYFRFGVLYVAEVITPDTQESPTLDWQNRMLALLGSRASLGASSLSVANQLGTSSQQFTPFQAGSIPPSRPTAFDAGRYIV